VHDFFSQNAELRVLPAAPLAFNHCWAKARYDGAQLDSPAANNFGNEFYACYHPDPVNLNVTDQNSTTTIPFLHSGKIPITSNSACGSAYAGKGLTHVGMSDEIADGIQLARTCTRIGSGAWSCTGTFNFVQGNVVSQNVNNSTSHRHAAGVLTSDLHPVSLVLWGVGHDAFGVVQFEHPTSCAPSVP
jgi:hypothetical protein